MEPTDPLAPAARDQLRRIRCEWKRDKPAGVPPRWFFDAEAGGASGDRPSWGEWPYENRWRRRLYDTLVHLGHADAHLTDVYKGRGASTWLKDGDVPADFERHVQLLRRELDLLKPRRIVAMGHRATRLLAKHLSERNERGRRVLAYEIVYLRHCSHRFTDDEPWAEMLEEAVGLALR